ncbi:MAG: protein-tyrosine-phosphatase [Myxococcota bacterium]
MPWAPRNASMLLTILLSIMTQAPGAPTSIHPKLGRFAAARTAEFSEISEDRKAQLAKLARWIEAQRASRLPARLVFICTHNSRRSHIAEHWARVAASLRGLSDVETFSGGTEATAFSPRSVAALRRAGFEIQVVEGSDPGNPRHLVSYAESLPSVPAFSKIYSDELNPREGFAAVMTCSSADQACPFVLGASARIPIPYEDPKRADGTAGEAATYDERVSEIAREMLFLMSLVDA